MERNKPKEAVSGYEYAYKKKSSSIDKRAMRLHRRSIEWKNNRGDRLNSARNLESLSPLQEISQMNGTNTDRSYEEKTPLKKPDAAKSIENVTKENSKGTQQRVLKDKLAKWREEKQLKKKLDAREKAKNKPFKVTHIAYKDLEKLEAKIKATKASVQSKQIKPATEKTFQPPAVTVIKKPAVSKPTTITRQSVPNATNNTKPAVATRSSLRPPSSTNKAKTFQKPVHSAPLTRTKAPPAKGAISATKGPSKTLQKKSLQVDLHKVSTSRGQSFAPEEFTFHAPSNLSSFVFRPLSPNSASSFLNPTQDGGASFIGTDPKRCSTPKSSDSVKNGVNDDVFSQGNESSEQTFKGDTDETLKTNETVKDVSFDQPFRRSSRQKDRKTSGNTSHITRASQSKVQCLERETESNSSRTRSTQRSQDLSRSRRLSQEKRTLDRSSSRRLSQGSMANERSLSRPRTRSSKMQENTPTSARKNSSKRSRADTENKVSDDERTSKRSKSVHVEESPMSLPVKSDIDDKSDIPMVKPITDLKQSFIEEKKTTPKRRSLRISRKSLAEAVVVSKPVDKAESYEDSDGVFETNDVEDKTTVESDNQVNNGVFETNDVECETKVESDNQVNDGVFETNDVERETTVENDNQVNDGVFETNDVEHETKVESDNQVKNDPTPTAENAELCRIETPHRRQSVRRSLQSKPSGLEEIIVAESSPKPLTEEPTEEVNDENRPVKKITRSTKRRSMSSLDGFVKPDADSVVLSAKRTANKKKRRKTVYDHTIVKSPEEWIKLLQNSPMVEMNRRTPKQKTPPPPALDFDLDLDELENCNPSKILNFSACDEQTNEPVTEREVNNVDQIEKESSPQKYNVQELQVDEVSTTQESDKSDNNSKTQEHDIAYFRHLLQSETDRLNQLCQKWDDINTNTPHLTEDVKGQLRTVVGQGQLLVAQRFKQFIGLVDNCEFKLGEKETTCTDLEGFWEMIYFQVEDVNAKFISLGILQENNWDLSSIQPKKKIIKKKIISKPVTKKPAVKSKFAAFRACMKNKTVTNTEDKTFDAGFFKVQSPVKKPSPHCEASSPRHSVNKDAPESDSPMETEQTNKEEKPDAALLTTSLVTPLKRKSYAPNVPSPLLQDITPQPRPTRSSAYRKTPLPKNILSDVDDKVIMDTNLTNIAQDLAKTLSEKKLVPVANEVTGSLSESKPRRRSTRTRKSVSFCDSLAVPDEEEKTEEQDPFSKYLQPMTPRMSMAPKGYSVLDAIPSDDSFTTHAEANSDDSFTTHAESNSQLIFSPAFNVTDHNDSVTKTTRSRHSSLKQLPTRDRRRSTRKSVQFTSPKTENIHVQGNEDILMTPPSRPVSSNTSTPESSDGEINRFSSLNIGFTPVARSTRPSLLFTPPRDEDSSISVSFNTNVPTAQLISFTP